ncbi:hypothetical protein [Antarctobacter heliothermus]|uniref:Polysaccharide biosynthesis protein n=1 Tax=Antarctobacter heliothermus TaxID=74033 RepID=A0A239D8Y4_9RHOB|nr:hypothetical protein [Antarctobacter heliothermus]SNS28835.1 hypothetical protein SAMN04488078_10108 [Antarctobacter heliothermus]
MPKAFLSTAAAEFLSRFLIWARVLALGAFMPVDDYGFILVLLGIEGLLAAVVAYPSIKDVVVRQDISVSVFRHFSLLFCIIAFPVLCILLWVSGQSMAVALTAIIAALLNGWGQIGLYMMRVSDLSTYNRTKLIWAFATTAVFMVALPMHWAFLPLVYGVGALPIMLGLVRYFREPSFAPAFVPIRGYHARGWIIYSTQALLTNFPQFGIRLFVASTMTLAHVAAYTQTYMVSTAVFFGFSAVMVVFEPRLSRAAPIKEIAARLPLMLKVSALFVVLTILYAVFLSVVVQSGLLTHVLGKDVTIDQQLLVPIMVFIALSGVFTVVNCLVLAGSGRAISLLSTGLGSATLFLGLAISLPVPTLFGVGVAIALSQGVALAILVLFLTSRVAQIDGAV